MKQLYAWSAVAIIVTASTAGDGACKCLVAVGGDGTVAALINEQPDVPIAVMALVYFTSPQYIELLWTTPMGHVMLAGSVLWMTMGILVMRKMINFDF